VSSLSRQKKLMEEKAPASEGGRYNGNMAT
jgi:hypothetical protein